MEQPSMEHKLCLTDRKKLTMTGVTEVIRFDDTTVVLKTGLGSLVIQGKDLQLKELSTDGGQMAVLGTITALGYQEQRSASGWLSRLFQ